MANSYSGLFNLSQESNLKEKLSGFQFEQVQHAFWRAKGQNVSATLYKSGKILVQGKGTEEFVKQYLSSAKQLKTSSASNDSTEHNFSSWIGTDESGKGDFFGPLIIASVAVEPKNLEVLSSFGIQDSKKLSDVQIEKLALKIKQNAIFSVVTITPAKYNQLYDKFKNLNRLLAWGHARAIENILDKEAGKHIENAISDKFGNESLIKNALIDKGKKINLIQRVRAESDLAVAAASILARNEFVNRIARLSQEYGITLPKGASAEVLKAGKTFVEKHGKADLANVAKLHFKTTKEL